MISKNEKLGLSTNNKSKISLWLDKELIKVLKSKNIKAKLNEEFQEFFKYNEDTLNAPVELTLDSSYEIQQMIASLNKFNNELTAISKTYSSFTDILIQYWTDLFYYDENNSEEDDDNDCDRLSAYFGALNERTKDINEMVINDQIYNSIQQDVFIKKINQIKKFYNISDEKLEKFKDKQELIRFLIKLISSNKDICYLLKYKNIKNRLGKLYTPKNISKQHYMIKKYLIAQ